MKHILNSCGKKMIKYYPFKCELVWKNLPQDKQSQYKSIKRAASISYGKESSKAPEEFVRMIIKKGHHSVLEHTNIAIKVSLKHFTEFPQYIFNKSPYIHLESNYEKAAFYPDYFIIRTNLRALLDIIEKSKHIYDEVLVNICLFLQRHYPEIFNLKMIKRSFMGEYPIDIRFLDDCEYVNTKLDRFCFYIECSRNISHQIVRHRSLSFNQESQRYVDYSEELPICLFDLSEEKGLGDIVSNQNEVDNYILANKCFYDDCQAQYNKVLNLGYKKEQARGVLPGDTRTRLYVTGYRKDFEHFIESRNSKHAQPEIRWIAQQIKKKIK